MAACSPKQHEVTFMDVCEQAGINPQLFQLANIREQCAWVTPNGEEARFMFGDIYGSQEWADEVVWMCKELSCDAIVYYQLVGCLHIGAPIRMVADTVKEKLGLPTLVMSGRLYDPTILPSAEVEATLTSFVDTVMARKG